MSSDTSTFKIISYLAAGGSVLMYHSYKQIKKKTKMIIEARQLIAAASAGSVEIEAVAWPFRAIDNSLDGKKVVFRHLVLQKLVRRGKNTSFETIWEKITPEPFLVFDQSGFMIINCHSNINSNLTSLTEGLSRKEYNPERLSELQLTSFDDFYDGNISGFRAKSSITKGLIAQLFSFKQFRVLERTIPIGGPLLILGNFNPEDTSRFVELSPELKLFKDRACKLLTNKNYQLSLLDKNKDGEVDLDELKNGFQTALTHSFKGTLDITDVKPKGLSNEKLYGTISSSINNELIIAEGLETQILKDSPIYRSWLGLYLGAAIVACSIILFIVLN